MEIKCKVSFTLPEELVDALELTDDTPIIASVSGNRITLEFADDEFENTEDDLCDEDEDDYDEHDLDDEDDCDEDDYLSGGSRWNCDDDCDNWWEEDIPSHEEDDCGFDHSCDECEYFCPNCGSCVLN